MTKWHLGAIKMIPEWLSFHNLFMSFIPEWRLYGIHMIKSNGLACKLFSLGWFSHQIRYAYATFPRLHNFWNELIPEWLVGEWNVVLVSSKQIQRKHICGDEMNSFQTESYWYRVKKYPFKCLKSKHKVEPSSHVVYTQISGEYQQQYLEFHRPNPHFKTWPMASNFLFVSCLFNRWSIFMLQVKIKVWLKSI